ncbi:tyrosine-type recombinase/integrase [Arthrobacter sp. Hz1]
MSTTTDVQRWEKAIADFTEALHRRGYAEATIEQRIKKVRALSRSVGVGPWAMEREQLEAWIDARPTKESQRTYRSALRAFYRWGYQAGRVFEDPAAEISHRTQKLNVPVVWAKELQQYRSYLRAAGRPETTVRKRMDSLNLLAREAVAGPWSIAFDDLVEWMQGKRWATETRRGYRQTLQSFYSWAVATGRVDENPAALLPLVKASLPSPRPVPEDIYRAALDQANEREQLMLRLSAEIGMRRGEVAEVHSRDLIGSADLWQLVVHGKGSRDRLIPLPIGLAMMLRNLPAGYAFPGQINGHLSPRRVGELVSALMPTGTTMHALRHRFATRAYDVGRDVFTVQKLLGHASPATTQRYVAVTDNAMRTLIQAVNVA